MAITVSRQHIFKISIWRSYLHSSAADAIFQSSCSNFCLFVCSILFSSHHTSWSSFESFFLWDASKCYAPLIYTVMRLPYLWPYRTSLEFLYIFGGDLYLWLELMGAEKLCLRVVLSQLLGKCGLQFPETAAVLWKREPEKEERGVWGVCVFMNTL